VILEKLLTGRNRSARRNICLAATLSITNRTWTTQGQNPRFRNEVQAISRLSRVNVLNIKGKKVGDVYCHALHLSS
jgi:hypothetical protein